MTTQRQTGIFLTLFTAAVVFNHWWHGELSVYDAIYSVLLVPLVLTAIIECQQCKAFQVLTIAWVGVMMVYAGGESVYLGVVIMAVSYLFSYTYGFLETWAKTKTGALVSIFTGTVFITTDFDPLRTLVWMMMCSVVLWAFWVNAKHLIEKDRKASKIIEMDLKRRAEATEALLEETVKAGMVLVDEIKSKDGERGNCN